MPTSACSARLPDTQPRPPGAARSSSPTSAAQPVCSASRAALLTGCYPSRIGIHGALGPNAKHGLNASEMTLAELLKQKDYATGMAGKWHLGRPQPFLPVHHGFDEYFGLPYSNDMWPYHPEARPGAYPPLPLIEGDQVIRREVTPADQTQLTTWYTERAVRFIERHRARPFLIYLAHSMPHVPLFVSDKFKGKSKQGLYGDVIMEIDWSVGEVMKTLKRCGLEKDTLVIFASDNGPWLSYGNHAGSPGPLREGKGTNWEGGTRVPCIMRWPGKLPRGKTSDAMFMNIDLLPTIANLVGTQPPAHKIDGLDVWSLLAGKKGATNPHAAYFYYYHQGQLEAVVSGDGRWKLQLPHAFRTLAGRPGGRTESPRNTHRPESPLRNSTICKVTLGKRRTSPPAIRKSWSVCSHWLKPRATIWATRSPNASGAGCASQVASSPMTDAWGVEEPGGPSAYHASLPPLCVSAVFSSIPYSALRGWLAA